MFTDITTYMAPMVKPALDASARVNGIRCNVYKRTKIKNKTQITGRGSELGSNANAYHKVPEYEDVYLLIDTPIKKGYKGQSVKGGTADETVDSMTEEKSYIVTYPGQWDIDWETTMKVELFYTNEGLVPEVTYETTRIEEIPLANNETVHSGIIHVHLRPML